MRLGLLGPAQGELSSLGRAARAMKSTLGADRVVYLGADAALDTTILDWAKELVGQNADDSSLLGRATTACAAGQPAEIDEFLRRERERLGLRMFESLPSDTTRSVELIGGKVAVMLFDKAMLVEEDILPATLLIFGKSREPMLKQVGRRWFLSPGTFPHHGVLIVEESEGALQATIYDAEFAPKETVSLEAPKTLRMRVAGSG